MLSNRTSVITGSVANDRGVPANDYVVVVYADDRDRSGPLSRYVGSARPDQQDSFEIKGLPTANYLGVAVEYLEEGQDSDPELLQQLKTSATSFLLADNERKVLALKVVAER